MKKVAKYFAIFAGICVVVGGIALGATLAVFLPQLPSIEKIREIPLKVPLRVYSVDGALLAEYGDFRREPVTIDEAPERLIQAILAAEDDRFFKHHGVDFVGVGRAFLANLKAGGIDQGASTITMQVARNYFLTKEKTYTRKIKEVLLSFKIERLLSKDEILELYINKIFLGHRAYGFAAAAKAYYDAELDQLTLAQIAMLAGLPKAPSRTNPISNPARAVERRNYVLSRMRGLDLIDDIQYRESSSAPVSADRYLAKVDLEAPYVAEMARSYMVETFGPDAYTKGYRVYTTVNSRYQRSANDALRKGLLAYDKRHGFRGPVGIIELPDRLDPIAVSEALEAFPKVGSVIPVMVTAITSDRISFVTTEGDEFHVLPDQWQWAGKISTKLAPGDVIYVEKELETGPWRLSQMPEVQGALVSVDPREGSILALIGGFDYYSGKFNRVTQAQRQPGSNLKPFIYSAAMDNGFTPASLVSGAPIVVDNDLEGVWRPENYSRRFFGPTPIRKALSLSLNLVSVRLVRSLGTDLVLDHLSRFGFDRERLPKGLSLALGAASLTPLEVVRGYAVFANGGYLVEPYLIARVEDQSGEILSYGNRQPVCVECGNDSTEHALANTEWNVDVDPRYAKRAISPENAYLMQSLLGQVIKTGTGRRALSLGRSDLAGKTGTTNNFRDAWFSGFNPDVVTTVWVGFDTPKDLGRSESGAKAALPIWIDYMDTALSGKPDRPRQPPENVITAFVHKDTGEPTLPTDPNGYPEHFVMGTEPHIGSTPRPLDDTNQPRNQKTRVEDLF